MGEQGRTEREPPRIEDGAWIGLRATILPGRVVGEGAIVGACAVVTRDVAPYAVARREPGPGDRPPRRLIASAARAGASRCTAWPAPGTTTTSASGSRGPYPHAIALNFAVALAGDQRDRHAQLAKPVPQRRQRAGAEAAERAGEPGRGVAQPVGMRPALRPPAAAPRAPASAPSARELLDAHLLDLVGEAVIGGAALRALGGVGDPGAGADQHQPLDALAAGASAAWSAIRPPIEYPTSVNRGRAPARHVVEHGRPA